jgi:hypothetical protein
MSDWIVRLGCDEVGPLARLRNIAGLRVAETNDALWLRAGAGDEPLERLLAGLGGERFVLIEQAQLVPWGLRVPSERLPPLTWQPLADWASVRLPVAALAAQVSLRQPLRLVRGGQEQPPTALLVEWRRWQSYATTAAEVRLRSLVFALSSDNRALIWGTPLPPIPGQQFAIEGGIAAPCGWSLTPAVGSNVVRKVLNLAEGDLALFAIDGTFERIAGENLVKASRSAVRASALGESRV